MFQKSHIEHTQPLPPVDGNVLNCHSGFDSVLQDLLVTTNAFAKYRPPAVEALRFFFW